MRMMTMIYWRKYLHQSSVNMFGLIQEEILYYITITSLCYNYVWHLQFPSTIITTSAFVLSWSKDYHPLVNWQIFRPIWLSNLLQFLIYDLRLPWCMWLVRYGILSSEFWKTKYDSHFAKLSLSRTDRPALATYHELWFILLPIHWLKENLNNSEKNNNVSEKNLKFRLYL